MCVGLTDLIKNSTHTHKHIYIQRERYRERESRESCIWRFNAMFGSVKVGGTKKKCLNVSSYPNLVHLGEKTKKQRKV